MVPTSSVLAAQDEASGRLGLPEPGDRDGFAEHGQWLRRQPVARPFGKVGRTVVVEEVGRRLRRAELHPPAVIDAHEHGGVAQGIAGSRCVHRLSFDGQPRREVHDMPYSVDELVSATKATVKATGLPSCYVRPIAYYGYGEMGLNTLPCSVDVAIACWPWGAYLGDDAVEKGVRMKISSWSRHDHNTMPPASKTTGNYVNSSLAKVEALKAGYDEAIMLNPQGLVSECTGENIFCVRNGRIITPPLSSGALEGITQSSVTSIGRDLGYEIVIGDLARSDLYIAEEIFVCGTAAEISSVNSVDDRAIPCPGPITRSIAEIYTKAVRGQVDRYKDWVEHVDE